MGKRTVDIPEEFCINGDVVVTIKYGPDGVEQPPEFRYCSQHALSATPRLMAVAAKTSIGCLTEEEFKSCIATLPEVRVLVDRFGAFSPVSRHASDLCGNGALSRAQQLLICTAALTLTAGVNQSLAIIESAADFDEKIGQLGLALSAYERGRAKAATSGTPVAAAAAADVVVVGEPSAASQSAFFEAAKLLTDATKITNRQLSDALKLVQDGEVLDPAAAPKDLGGLFKAMSQRLTGTDLTFQRALRVALTLNPDIDQKQLMKLLTIEVPTNVAEFVALLCKLTGNTEPSLAMLLELQALLDALARLGYIHLSFFNLVQQLRAFLSHVDKASFIASIYVLIIHAVAQHILDSFHEFKRCAAAGLAYLPLATWSVNATRGLNGFEGQFNVVAVEMRAIAEKRAATENARLTGGQRQRQQHGWGHAGLNQT
eukprot:CAMPEP_0171848352 /NCGR_PEP_ID=MMETSP0992-20121227/18946_1 /TAXON_ID=483369 /ORGANISM="non described non described, Strain CCMP2098" /LENGTH=429 /DNA_ID=CAMNT_0012467187 /DNA_START=287 /DNA_END=1571 /DNA_ORIENTATION=+